ncbi:hypothetical protein ABBQ32_002728 [Trebouxia sp. C0010 RCD-2024]
MIRPSGGRGPAFDSPIAPAFWCATHIFGAHNAAWMPLCMHKELKARNWLNAPLDVSTGHSLIPVAFNSIGIIIYKYKLHQAPVGSSSRCYERACITLLPRIAVMDHRIFLPRSLATCTVLVVHCTDFKTRFSLPAYNACNAYC